MDAKTKYKNKLEKFYFNYEMSYSTLSGKFLHMTRRKDQKKFRSLEEYINDIEDYNFREHFKQFQRERFTERYTIVDGFKMRHIPIPVLKKSDKKFLFGAKKARKTYDLSRKT